MRKEQSVLPSLALLIGVGILEALLLRIAGPPPGHIHVLTDVVKPMAEPLEGMLAALALTGEALAGYLILALALRTLTHLPGLAGQVANGAERMLTVPAVRRGFDLLLGGALIAHLVLAPPSTGTGTGTVQALPLILATAAPSTEHGLSWTKPAGRRADDSKANKVPPPASAVALSPLPLPIWLCGGPALDGTTRDSGPLQAGTAKARHTIAPGETLWSIAAGHLPANARTQAIIASYWRRIYDANRGVIGSDPDRILPGVTLSVPPYLTSPRSPVDLGSARAGESVWPRPGCSDNPRSALP